MPLHLGLTAASLRFVYGAPATALPVAVPPTLVADAASLINLDTATVRPLANDAAPEGQSLTLLSIGSPAHGTASLDGDVVTYRPTAGYVGQDQVTYTALASGGGLASSLITFDVKDPPPLIVSEAGDAIVTENGQFLALESA